MSDTPILSLDLPNYAEAAYLQYAIAVVKGRALADVRDGLKPVQRRILYAMGQLGLQHPAKPVKSARVVGDVLGKYHPHGDQSVYDALVRMAQPFTLRYPLVDGQGNFGSLDGDSAAAMRYTEARLTPLAQVLLAELHSGTVDFTDNYDGSFQEPTLTPARLPMLLLNGTSGIAVGMAADCPSHNLREVANAAALVLREPSASLDDVLGLLPGPDFPGGGQLVAAPAEIRAAYAQGRGSLRCRARWRREELARGQWQLVVHELPFQVSTRKILEELDALTNPKPPAGKKTITQQQSNLKAVALDLIERAADESDKDSGIRLVIAPRTSKVDESALTAFLLANTSMETNAPLNLTVIGRDGRPATKGVVDVLLEWSQFRTEVVSRRTQFELAGVEKRIHLLEGRHIAFINLEAVIQVIREAADAKPELMARFKLSEIQAENILEMRLRQLNRLEGVKLEQDLEIARAEATRLRFLLDNSGALRDLVVSEIEAVGAQFGDDRRTQIAPAERVAAASRVPAVLDEPLTVVVTKGLWVKSFKGHGLAADSLTVKTADTAQFVVETTAAKPVVVLDSAGRAYSFAASSVPGGRGEGAPLSTLLELQAGALPVAVLAGEMEDRWAFSTSEGYGFISALKHLVARPKAGKAFLAVGPGAAVLPPVPVPSPVTGYFVSVNSQSRVLCFNAAELKELGGGKGVVLQDLEEGLRLTRFWHVPEAAFSVHATSKSGKVSTFAVNGDAWPKYLSKRGRKGCYLPNKEVIG